jgi:hypothetical protein
MSPEEQAAVIEQAANKRRELVREIRELARQRDEYLRKEVSERGGASDSLDDKVYRTVREQAAAVGLSYEADAPAY